MLALDFEASPDKVNDVEQFVVLRLAYANPVNFLLVWVPLTGIRW